MKHRLPNRTDSLRWAHNELRTLLEALGADVGSCCDDLEQYRLMLAHESNRWSITKYKGPPEIVLYHFVDSLQVLRFQGTEVERRVMDVGTGAGLPGVPCAIVRRGWRITLLDSRERLGGFLECVSRRLLPGRAGVLVERAETAAHRVSERGVYDLVLARAVAPLPVLLELTLPFLKAGGLLLAHRGVDWSGELTRARRSMEVLRGEVADVYPYRLGLRRGEHAVVAVRLTAPPPETYPRSPARIRRKPLV